MVGLLSRTVRVETGSHGDGQSDKVDGYGHDWRSSALRGLDNDGLTLDLRTSVSKSTHEGREEVADSAGAGDQVVADQEAPGARVPDRGEEGGLVVHLGFATGLETSRHAGDGKSLLLLGEPLGGGVVVGKDKEGRDGDQSGSST